MLIDNPKTILCYGDSNVRGMKPLGGRFIWGKRWTGQLQKKLGADFQVIEEGLNGRTSGVDDPLQPGRNGLSALPAILHTHLPLDVLIIMLGNNDFKSHLNLSLEEVIANRKKLIQRALEFGLKNILFIIGPELVVSNKPAIAQGFNQAKEQSHQQRQPMKEICNELKCDFIDAEQICSASTEDGLHLDEQAHTLLAQAVYDKIIAMKL